MSDSVKLPKSSFYVTDKESRKPLLPTSTIQELTIIAQKLKALDENDLAVAVLNRIEETVVTISDYIVVDRRNELTAGTVVDVGDRRYVLVPDWDKELEQGLVRVLFLEDFETSSFPSNTVIVRKDCEVITEFTNIEHS